ncbi:dihydroxyacetone kinase subunit DhaL [Streptomyces alkaliterrae]|uniref:Dihydroxyacetone kinase subunit L n=1 Tax=Streptomyces alkaliterrae TaxID=2213162 RepID=A0A5P0YXD9_9ACTN|nr:dihydroxyacetone kinase subunit DhaL [Streptomyces alkaliterrae]MBB1256509.1 dihydroxyacetone kinase subunit L [Streptomyces alkaliterrae]MBB1262144.1 dihydroxyacetone kinase subunit L [Streptomyces alkaliterrae]MQS04955.1 dihydroxyacetone kinase subunit L [Streptomyces alkaliterrae]
MDACARDVDREAKTLTELDAAIGDADHGDNMRRGFQAVTVALAEESPATPGAVLTLAGRTLISSVGGAAGPLYGTLLRRAGKELGDAPSTDLPGLRAALAAGVDGVARLGGAAAGDKTMLDALLPAVDALEGGLQAAATAARQGAVDTLPLLARKGRASYLGERSVGHQDPGAASSALLVAALVEAVGDE